MKKMLLLSALAFATTAGSGFAQSAGDFGYGIELTGTGSGALNSGVNTLYALDNSGTSRLKPIAGANVTSTLPTLSTAWTGASTASSPSFSLGTYVLGSTLTLDGGSFLTFKSGSADVTGTNLNYRITSGSTGSGPYTGSINLTFNEDNVNGATGDQRWAVDNAGVNLLAGLSVGTYTLSTYGQELTSLGTVYENNGGAGDFSATFTVVAPAPVPEPGTWAMMIGGLSALVLFQIRRRQTIG